MFGEIEIEKLVKKLHHHKNLMLLDVDTQKTQVSSGKRNYKYFFGYIDDNHNIKQLCTMFQKMNTHVKRYDGETKWKCFCIEDDDELLETCNDI